MTIDEYYVLRKDHPRSRGVYMTRAVVPAASHGSSPLARGLPPDEGVHPPRRGIIPARAGFTSTISPTRTCASDHPRSRGVYLKQIARDVEKTGSSPLARGLHYASQRR